MIKYFIENAALILTMLAGIVANSIFLYKNIGTLLDKVLENKTKKINDKIDTLGTKVDEVDMNATRNFLVRCLHDFENDREIDETEKERFWEQYDHYIKHGGNSYIKAKVEKFVKEGKL